MKIFFVQNFTENIYSLMSFCRKTSYSGGQSRNRKIIAKNCTFSSPPPPPTSRKLYQQVWLTFRTPLGKYSKHLSVIKPLLEIFSFSFTYFFCAKILSGCYTISVIVQAVCLVLHASFLEVWTCVSQWDKILGQSAKTLKKSIPRTTNICQRCQTTNQCSQMTFSKIRTNAVGKIRTE